MSQRLNRIPILFSDAELHDLDTWRFANRVGTRAGAVRALVKAGAEHPNQKLLEVALLASSAVDQLFAEGGFDGLYTSDGEAMSCTLINELQSKAKAAIAAARGDA